MVDGLLALLEKIHYRRSFGKCALEICRPAETVQHFVSQLEGIGPELSYHVQHHESRSHRFEEIPVAYTYVDSAAHAVRELRRRGGVGFGRRGKRHRIKCDAGELE